MNRKLLFVIAATGISTFLSGPAVAAIDDAGMRYISASEGLSGSIRVRMFQDGNDHDDNPAVGFDSSRIVYRGDSDLGGGAAVTYLLEFRPGDHTDIDGTTDGVPNNQFRIEYIDVGLKGRFGHFRVGAIESVSSAIVPSPDRTNDIGDDGEKLADDYRNGGWRWVSPDIRGFLVGVSAAIEDRIKAVPGATKDNKKIDQYDVAVAYSMPVGLDIGASYSLKQPLDAREEQLRQKGFRVGMAYERDNWGIGYNFHKYDAIVPAGKEFDQGEGNAGGVDIRVPGRKTNALANFHKDTEYTEHVVGANVSFGKFNFAASYSRANVSNPTLDTTASDSTVKGVDVNFSTKAVDIAYRLGTKAQIIAAYKENSVSGEKLHPGGNFTTLVSGGLQKYYLLTRIDF